MDNVQKRWIIAVFIIAVVSVFYFDISYAEVQNENFAKANELIKEGEYKEAIKEYMLALEAMPSSGEVHLYLAKAYNTVGEFELAKRHLDKATELGIQEKDTVIEAGYSLRRLGYYDEAIEKYKSALKYKVTEAEGYLGLGYCNMKLIKYDEADSTLDKAMELDIRLTAKAKLYKGIIKYEQKNYDGALEDLGVSLDTYKDSDTKVSAKNYVSAIKKIKRAERDFLLIASLSLLYDDNVITLSDSEALSISDKDDYGAIGYIRGVYYPIRTEENTMFLSYMFYQKVYSDLSEYDLQDHQVLFNYSAGFGDFGGLILRYDYNYYFLDNEKYFQKNNIMPTIRINETNKAYLDINLSASNKDYFKDKGLSSDGFEGGLKQAFITKSGASFYLSLDYKKEDTKDKDFEYTGLNLGLGFSQSVKNSMDIDLDLGYLMKDYENVHSVFLVERDDDVFTALFRIKKELSSSFSTSLRYDYTANVSNIEFYDYTRNVVFLELKYLY